MTAPAGRPAPALPAGDRGLRGTVRVPGDKSVSHRAALLGAVNDGPVTSHRLSALGGHAGDTGRCTRSRRAGGGGRRRPGRPRARLGRPEGAGRRHRRAQRGDAHPSAARAGGLRSRSSACSPATPASAAGRWPGCSRPLRDMGATVAGREHDSLPPIAIRGGGLRGMRHELAVASAQVKSCILLAGLRADGETRDRGTGGLARSHRTHDPLRRGPSGAGGSRLTGPGTVRVWPVREAQRWTRSRCPGDFSSAAFFIVAALLIEGSRVTVENAGLNPTRTGLLAVLERMGAAHRGRRRCRRPRAQSRWAASPPVPHTSWPPRCRPPRCRTSSTSCPCSCWPRPRPKASRVCAGRPNCGPRRATGYGRWLACSRALGVEVVEYPGRHGRRRRPERLGGRKHRHRGGPPGGHGRSDRRGGVDEKGRRSTMRIASPSLIPSFVRDLEGLEGR